MKLYKTLLFILALMAILAGIAWIFPEDGLRLGSLELRFPSL